MTIPDDIKKGRTNGRKKKGNYNEERCFTPLVKQIHIRYDAAAFFLFRLSLLRQNGKRRRNNFGSLVHPPGSPLNPSFHSRTPSGVFCSSPRPKCASHFRGLHKFEFCWWLCLSPFSSFGISPIPGSETASGRGRKLCPARRRRLSEVGRWGSGESVKW